MAITKIDAWLIAEGSESGRWYVVHALEPRFILEIIDVDDGYESGETMLLDPCEDAALLARLAREAGELFAAYDRQLDQGQEHPTD